MNRKLFVFDPGEYEQIGDYLRELSRRVHLRRTGRGDEARIPPEQGDVPDPDERNPAMGKAWLEKMGVQVVAPGASFHFQTLQDPCIVLPPFELLDPAPPVPYGFPEFYCVQCRKPGGHNGPVDLPFYLKRLADYTLTHCGD